MAERIWNPSGKLLMNIVKRVGYAVHPPLSADDYVYHQELLYVQCVLRPGAVSTFFGVDGCRYAKLTTHTSYQGDAVNVGLHYETFKEIAEAFKNETDIFVLFQDDKAVFYSGDKTECCPMIPWEWDSDNLVDITKDRSSTNILMTADKLMTLGGKERTSIFKMIGLDSSWVYESGAAYEVIKWTVEGWDGSFNDLYVTGELTGKKKAHWDSIGERTVSRTSVWLNYGYLMQALKCLPKKAEVRFGIGDTDLTPVYIAADGHDWEYEAVILPINIDAARKYA